MILCILLEYRMSKRRSTFDWVLNRTPEPQNGHLVSILFLTPGRNPDFQPAKSRIYYTAATACVGTSLQTVRVVQPTSVKQLHLFRVASEQYEVSRLDYGSVLLYWTCS